MSRGGETPKPSSLHPYIRSHQELTLWFATGMAILILFVLFQRFPWLKELPEDTAIPFDVWLNTSMEWLISNFKWLFRSVSWSLKWPLYGLRTALHWLPWSVTVVAFVMTASVIEGRRLAIFTLCALSYIVIVGYWDESMNTLALVGVAIPLSIVAGLLLGFLSFRYSLINAVVQPTLNLMQTIPTFAYLIPILLLFGFGPVVGLVASAIYACPPMIRNVILGLSRVPEDVIESGKMAGCTAAQILWWVQIPTALSTILIGVNQTIMAGFSMVIIAAIIGGFADIGWEVLTTMRKAQFGQSLLAGMVIAFLAMVMDRVSRGFAKHYATSKKRKNGYWSRSLRFLMAFATLMMVFALARALPSLRDYPDSWVVYPAELLNGLLEWFTSNFFHVTNTIKNWTLFYFLLPFKIGLTKSVRPHIWGFIMTPWISFAYVGLTGGLALLISHFWSWRGSVAIVIVSGFYYFGTTGIPWAVLILGVTVMAFRIGGRRAGLFTLFGLSFILASGAWHRAMLSLELVGVAVLVSFLIGSTVGIWAARSDRLSTFLRPINDTLQTMPSFVVLIPILMVFMVGEFSALIAIISYAIVPAIRYTEHGIRNVPKEIVEAATMLGCKRGQLLWQVQLPLALPEIMLGLNQTIMMALAMLVIAALVGTLGLGQMVYEALAEANFGRGAIAGLGIAFIAMIGDRIIQSWSLRKKAELGLV